LEKYIEQENKIVRPIPKSSWKEGRRLLELGTQTCQHCKKLATTYFEFSYCSKCRKMCYCSNTCLQKDWIEKHFKICPIIMNLDYMGEID
jgi:hypothetical protein